MKPTRFIGDVHGKYERYKTILKGSPPGTIQVGDMGVGFLHSSGKPHANPPYDKMVEHKARFIRGNHDNPSVCKQHSQWVRDGHIEDGMMFVGGATSIDKQFRAPGYSWWEDEQLSEAEFEEILAFYEKEKPEVMVTHDCPQSLIEPVFGIHYKTQLEPGGTRTRLYFERLFNLHRPKLWVFGHWHISRDVMVHGTRFVCLAELEWKDLEP